MPSCSHLGRSVAQVDGAGGPLVADATPVWAPATRRHCTWSSAAAAVDGTKLGRTTHTRVCPGAAAALPWMRRGPATPSTWTRGAPGERRGVLFNMVGDECTRAAA